MKSDFRINGHAVSEGCVSSGTLRTEDLMRNFVDEAKRVCTLTPEIVSEAEAWLGGIQSWKDYYELEAVVNEQDEYDCDGLALVARLDDHLNSLAPDGWRFGASEGDGADFGWWRIEDDL